MSNQKKTSRRSFIKTALGGASVAIAGCSAPQNKTDQTSGDTDLNKTVEETLEPEDQRSQEIQNAVNRIEKH